MVKIYNTLTRKKEDFTPLEEGHVKIYVCGPTVYDLIHIGNARPMIVFDTVRRYFIHKGFEVSYVSNFTDVDDKIIARANRDGVSASEISEHYIEECKKDMKGLNCLEATIHPKATEEIESMIEMISVLKDKGYAYLAEDGTVYYRTRAFKDYGKLSHKNIDDLEAGHRSIDVSGESKEDPLDFVLWKPKKEGEPFWHSPWCDGRPGWHIECSCMSKRYLGDSIDIHAGGEDLIFPHHENEIAQSEASNGKTFARYWMHNGFLNIDKKKMSKSLGNFFTVRDISKKYDLQVLRFFMLSAHYRSPLNFSEELMQQAKSGLDRIKTCADTLRFKKESAEKKELDQKEKEILKEVSGFIKGFEDAMDDDFNTADAIASIFEFVRFVNTNIKDASSEFASELYSTLELLCDILGIIIEQDKELLDEEIEAMIQERNAARKAGDYAKADKIREELKNKGIALKDTREGVQWTRI